MLKHYQKKSFNSVQTLWYKSNFSVEYWQNHFNGYNVFSIGVPHSSEGIATHTEGTYGRNCDTFFF